MINKDTIYNPDMNKASDNYMLQNEYRAEMWYEGEAALSKKPLLKLETKII